MSPTQRKQLEQILKALFAAECQTPQGTYSLLQEWAVENAPAHWISNEDIGLDHDEIVEMLQTGSVTTLMAGRKFELSIHVLEVT